MDKRSNLENFAEALVAEQVGEELVGALGGLNFIELRSADATESHLHEHLSGQQLLWEPYLVNHEWLSAVFEDCRLELFLLHLDPLLEVDELVVAGVAEVLVEPDPFALIQE